MRRILAALFLLALPLSVQAQQSVLLNYRASPTVVTEVSPTNPLPVTGSFSAGGFAPASTGTPITATTGGATGTLPAGTVVVATNVGTTNGAYCALGGAANTSSQYIAPNGGWFSFTVGAATQLTCATSTSTTTVNMTGGAGLATGTGGGGGSSGGGLSVAFAGAIGANGTPGGFQDGSGNFQPLLGDVTNGQWVNVKTSVLPAGAATSNNQSTMLTNVGAPGDTACATANGSCSLIALQKYGNQQNATTATNSAAPIPGLNGSAQSSSNPMGYVNINQTTPGTTNAVAIDQTTPGTTNKVVTSVASGGIASGAIAAGAQVDLLTMRGTKAAGTAAANSLLAGAVYNATAPTLTDGQQAALQVGPRGGLLIGGAGYPAGSTPITISGTGTTGATTANLGTPSASYTIYICGFSIRANANAAVTGNATVTGTITGTLNFTQWTAVNTTGLGVTEEIFTPCIPASAANTQIAIISAAPSTGGVVSVTGWGFTL